MKLTIGKKLGLSFAGVLVIMIVSSGVSYWEAHKIRGVEERLDIHRLEPESALRVPAGLKSGSEQGARSHLFGIPSPSGGESAKSV